MFQDLNYKHSPEARAQIGLGLEELDQMYLAWFRAARWIFPISEEARRELLAFAPAFADKIHAVPLGSNPERRHLSPEAALNHRKAGTEPAKEGTDGRGRPRRVFYCPANVYPHKNHLLLLEAFAETLEAGADVSLVLTGLDTQKIVSSNPQPMPHIEMARQFCTARRNLFGDRLQALGRIPWELVDDCYARADAIILPSSYEGFGLPLLEAMERRKPVLCSDISVFREQIDRYRFAGAITFPLNNLAGLTAAWREMLAALDVGEIQHAALGADLDRWTWRHAALAYLETMADPDERCS